MEDLAITTLEESIGPTEGTCHQGEMQLFKENLDSEGEDFQYSDEEYLNYNVYFYSFILIYLKRKQQYISNVITK